MSQQQQPPGSVIEVFNEDGTMQSVCLHSQVRTDEVIGAIARRLNTASDIVPFFGLYMVMFDTIDLSILEMKRLNPEDRPLKIFQLGISNIKTKFANHERTRIPRIAFAFLDTNSEATYRKKGVFVISKEGSVSKVLEQQSRGNENPNFSAPGVMNSFGRGDKSGFLFVRSAANPREWQRRWCILRKDEIAHCLTNTDQSEATIVKLTQNNVSIINDLEGLRHCFEIDTPRDVLYFRAKTEEEANSWVTLIQRNITLASENEKFHLAERMIEDGQKLICSRDENMLSRAMGSLDGLLSTHAGADRLFRFARRNAVGTAKNRNAELISFYVELERAQTNLPSESVLSDPRYNRGAPSIRRLHRDSITSLSGASSSMSLSHVRSSVAIMSLKEYMLQVCDKIAELFAGDTPEEQALHRESDALRHELTADHLDGDSRQVCLRIIKEARQLVLLELENGLYRSFVDSEVYSATIAAIPSNVRASQSIATSH